MNLLAPLTDKANALEALAASDLVYSTSTIQTAGCHVLIQEFDAFTGVTFRGSKSIEDWIHDAEFDLITVSGGMVHRGIWMSYQTVSSALRARLNKAKPIIPRGHSLGGLQSAFCAWDLDGEYAVNRVINFGSPQAGNQQFVDNYNKSLGAKTIRFVNGRDIVPHLPGEELEYRHVGQEGFLPSAGGFAYNPSIWELLRDDVRGAVADIEAGKLELLNDHHLTRYQSRLEALV